MYIAQRYSNQEKILIQTIGTNTFEYWMYAVWQIARMRGMAWWTLKAKSLLMEQGLWQALKHVLPAERRNQPSK